MKFSSAIVFFAGFAAAALEQTETTDSTTTLTSTLTKTMTLTRCNPTYTDCPYATPTSVEVEETTIAVEETTTPIVEPSYPAHNTTVVAPTGGFTNTTSVGPTLVTETATSIVDDVTETEPAVVTDSGAGSLYANSGLLVAVLAAGAALL